MGWLIALVILTGIAFIPIGASVKYDAEGFLVRLIVGFLRITVFPFKKKGKKPDNQDNQEKAGEESVKKQETVPNPPQKSGEETKGGSIRDFLPLIKVALDFLKQFKNMLHVNHLQLKLILAGDDPCDLAVNYGRAWAALGNLIPVLERTVSLGKRDCEVECDFTAQETRIIARADLTLFFWQLVFLGTVYGFYLIKELLIFKKKRKGGAVQ